MKAKIMAITCLTEGVRKDGALALGSEWSNVVHGRCYGRFRNLAFIYRLTVATACGEEP